MFVFSLHWHRILLLLDSFGSIKVAELNWGDEDQIKAVEPPFDYIIGTDVVSSRNANIWSMICFYLLAGIITHKMNPQSLVLLLVPWWLTLLISFFSHNWCLFWSLLSLLILHFLPFMSTTFILVLTRFMQNISWNHFCRQFLHYLDPKPQFWYCNLKLA